MVGHGARAMRHVLETARALDVSRGLHLTIAALLLVANAGYAVPATVATPTVTETTRGAPFGVDGGTAPFLQPPVASLPKVVTVSAHPENHDERLTSDLVEHGIPRSVLRAYSAAAHHSAQSDPQCGLTVALLAAIGRVESYHAQGGNVDSTGTTLQPILGPRLDGGPGVAAIADTDDGRYDGDTTWDRATGPMQFIPSTWASWGDDGNGDGVADPHNIYDAAVAAGNYLCAGERDLRHTGDLHAAILSYNHSTQYLRVVLAWLHVYSGRTVAVPDMRHDGPVAASHRTDAHPTREKTTPEPSQPPNRRRTSVTSSPPVLAAAPTRSPQEPKRSPDRDEPPPDERDAVTAVRDAADELTNIAGTEAVPHP